MTVSAEGLLEAPSGDQGFVVSGSRRAVPIRLAATAEGEATLEIALGAVVCGHADAEACFPIEARYRLPVSIGRGGPVADATLCLPAPADERPA